ncbi:MAG: alpha-L-fucosidase [Chitinophagaceae bacterium]|nr:MAG: alpha-L-fucosidase [Chitinophagaceae bacterium]
MKQLTVLLFCLLFVCTVNAQGKKIFKETAAEKDQRLAWWQNDRFGMFIHWGLYSLPARHEWIKNYERITDSAYQKYFDNFNPDLFQPKEWARMAKAAGMKYAVLTSKHHEGFCLFDSKYTDYKATNTQAKRDLVKEFVDAFRAEGLKVGFYYSLIDWHHPDFTIDGVHPQRVDDPKKYAALNKGKDMSKYRDYLQKQVTELLTNYGKIDIMWMDFSYPGENGKGKDDWGAVELIKTVRKLQPGIIVNDRMDLRGEYEDGGDFVTPEQYKVAEWPMENGKRVPWETCQTFSGSWGYYRDENTWKDNKQLLTLLIESVSKGGNVLLNVGPTARGLFDNRASKALGKMGEWMQLNSRSIYGCTQADGFTKPDNCLLTYNAKTKRLYVHLLDYPLQKIVLPGLKGKVKYAQFLHDNSEIRSTDRDGYGYQSASGNDGDLSLSLPVIKPDTEIPVIELILN